MSQEQSEAQPVVQAGSTGETAKVGLEVGVLRSSGETPVTGVERRRDTCPDVSSGTWPKAPQGDKPRGRKVPNTDCGHGGNAIAELDSESRIREIRPSGLMRGRSRRFRTNNYGRFNLLRPVPAYSTNRVGKRVRALHSRV
jgi:uncharacterized Zn-binding protein involved in type VI secretion